MMWGALSDERVGLSFTIAAGPRQGSLSRVQIPQGSWPYFAVSHSRPPNLEGQVPVFISPRTRVARLYPQALGSFFVASYNCRAMVEVFVPASTREIWTLKWTVVSEWVTLRPTVSRPVYLGAKHPSGAYDQIFITVRQLRACWNGSPSLTRGRVCLLLCTMSICPHFTWYIALFFH
jgi:hypothetical protein